MSYIVQVMSASSGEFNRIGEHRELEDAITDARKESERCIPGTAVYNVVSSDGTEHYRRGWISKQKEMEL